MSQLRSPARRLLVLPLVTALALLPSCDGEGPGPPVPGALEETSPPGSEREPPDTTGPAADAPATTGTTVETRGLETAGGLGVVPRIVEEVAPSIVAILVSNAQGPAGQGSGVIWSTDGYVITNNHVVEVGDRIEVVLASGRRLPAELVGTDPATDLAVVQVEGAGLPAATFAEELPAVGELAVALGNPFGFAGTVTAGIISGLERDLPIPETPLVGLIQTDAPISPGNSGGALVSAAGEVVGINVAAIPPQAGAVAIGFAIPAPLASDVAESLVETGSVDHPFLGIVGAPLTPATATEFGLDPGGVIVAQLSPGGPAEQAGLRTGDVIVGLAGAEIEDLGDLLSELRAHDPGDTVPLRIVRDGEEMEVEVALGTLPS